MAGSVDQYLGGTFALTRDLGAANLTEITLSEQGTVNAATDIANVALYYDLDTTLPRDCTSESYAGTEPQLGTTATGGFSGPDGTVTFSSLALEVGSTQSVCLYVVLDVAASSTEGLTLDVTIANPSADVVITTLQSVPVARFLRLVKQLSKDQFWIN